MQDRDISTSQKKLSAVKLQAADILSKINIAQEEQRQQLALVSSQQLQGVRLNPPLNMRKLPMFGAKIDPSKCKFVWPTED